MIMIKFGHVMGIVTKHFKMNHN